MKTAAIVLGLFLAGCASVPVSQWQWMRESNTGVAVGKVDPAGAVQWTLPFRDIDVSRDGNHWFHLFGSVCRHSLPAVGDIE